MNVHSILRRLITAAQALAIAVGFTGAATVGMIMSAGPAAAGPPAATPAPVVLTPCAITNTTNPIDAGANCSKGGSQRDSLFAPGGIFTVIANTLTLVVGAISVIYIIIGGLRYVTSGGDSKAVTAAKDTILYAVIGVIVAIVAFAVIHFVTTSLAAAN
jgi:hypothetical protein